MCFNGPHFVVEYMISTSIITWLQWLCVNFIYLNGTVPLWSDKTLTLPSMGQVIAVCAQLFEWSDLPGPWPWWVASRGPLTSRTAASLRPHTAAASRPLPGPWLVAGPPPSLAQSSLPSCTWTHSLHFYSGCLEHVFNVVEITCCRSFWEKYFWRVGKI